MSWIEKLKQKTYSQKRTIAFSISIVATLIIAGLWFLARSVMQN